MGVVFNKSLINDLVKKVKAIQAGGTVVTWTQNQETGTKIAEITLDGQKTDVFAPQGSQVSWSQIQETGTKIAEVTIGGQKTDVYAPQGGAGGSLTAIDIPIASYQSSQGETGLPDNIMGTLKLLTDGTNVIIKGVSLNLFPMTTDFSAFLTGRRWNLNMANVSMNSFIGRGVAVVIDAMEDKALGTIPIDVRIVSNEGTLSGILITGEPLKGTVTGNVTLVDL